jgi:hypothetical protein
MNGESSIPFELTSMRLPFLFLLLLSQLACGSRYTASKCSSNPLPESYELLSLPSFSRLVYFFGRPNDRGPVDREIWADAKFEFSASLKYHYTKTDPKTLDCPQAVTLELKTPIPAEVQAMSHAFLALFERRLNADLRVLRTAFTQSVAAFQSRPPVQTQIGTLVGEVSSIHHVNRGDFVILGIYQQSYYDAFLANIDSRLGTSRKESTARQPSLLESFPIQLVRSRKLASSFPDLEEDLKHDDAASPSGNMVRPCCRRDRPNPPTLIYQFSRANKSSGSDLQANWPQRGGCS